MRIGFFLFSLFIIPYFLSLNSCMSINTTRDRLDIREKIVVFTFDDGPDEDTTPLLLDVLAKHNIKAFFCLLGLNAEQYPQIVKRIHNEGHLFINHGYSDKWAVNMKSEDFKKNLLLGEEAIKNALGFYPEPKLYRPHGSYYKPCQEKIIKDEGWTIIPATIRVYDAVSNSLKSAQTVKKTVDITVKNNGGIILLHDAREGFRQKKENINKNPDSPYNRLWIVQSVDEIITSLLNKGFILHHTDLLKAIGFEQAQSN